MKYALVLLLLTLTIGCVNNRPRTGQMIKRSGDEIMVCGQLVHTGAPVVLWTDPGGYDAYRTERRFVSWDKASFEKTTRDAGTAVTSPSRYNIRFTPASIQPVTRPTTHPSEGGTPLTPEQFETVRGGGWPLDLLRQK